MLKRQQLEKDEAREEERGVCFVSKEAFRMIPRITQTHSLVFKFWLCLRLPNEGHRFLTRQLQRLPTISPGLFVFWLTSPWSVHHRAAHHTEINMIRHVLHSLSSPPKQIWRREIKRTVSMSHFCTPPHVAQILTLMHALKLIALSCLSSWLRSAKFALMRGYFPEFSFFDPKKLLFPHSNINFTAGNHNNQMILYHVSKVGQNYKLVLFLVPTWKFNPPEFAYMCCAD